MKKTIFKSIVMGAFLMASVTANAQFDLNNLGKVVSSAVGSDLTSLITGKNNVSKEAIIGTWNYQQPAISFESSDMLKQAGGQLASAAIEKKLATQFTKVGITTGKFLITFGSDGTFSTIKDGSATSSGTYTLDGSKIKFSYLQGTANITGYAQLQNSTLSLFFDSSKLLSVIGKVNKYTSNSTLNAISSLAGSFDGMKTGLALTKYVAPVTTTKTSTSTSKAATVKKATKKKSTKKK